MIKKTVKKQQRSPINSAKKVIKQAQKAARQFKKKLKTPPKRKVAVAKKSPNRRVSKLEKGAVRVITLGGFEEVGRNMIAVEVGGDIVIVDTGFEFVSDPATPGIDYIIPNIEYLVKRKNKIRGIFLTHGHLDHIGGLPFILPKLGDVPVFGSRLTISIVKQKLLEKGLLASTDLRVVFPEEEFMLGKTRCRGFSVTHSIPESMGIIVDTPQGNIVISGDLKLDHHEGDPTPEEVARFELFQNEDNLLLISDSTNAEKPGFSITEREVQENLASVIRGATSRLIVGIFASQLSRIISIIEVAKASGKKIVIEGRSIRNNVDIAREIALFSDDSGTIIDAQKMKSYNQDQIVILCTGAQGEEFAALNRIVEGKSPHIKLNSRDMVVLSSSIIPGNENAVQDLKDRLLGFGLKIIHYRTSDVHSTGHGNAGELVWINQQVRPKYFVPGYGFRSMLRAHAEAVAEAGFDRNNIFLTENGVIIEFKNGEMEPRKTKAPSEMMTVDGHYFGKANMALLEERRALSEAGFFHVTLAVSKRTKTIIRQPHIVTRGLADSANTEKMQNDVNRITKKYGPLIKKGAPGINKLQDSLCNALEDHLHKTTGKRTVVLVSVLEA